MESSSFSPCLRILLVFIFLSSPLMAQELCVKLVVKIEKSIRSNDSVALMLIKSNDTIVAQKNGNLFCFPDTVSFVEVMDVQIKSNRQILMFDSLFHGFLKITDNPVWIVVFDKKPFIKKNYPQIKKWIGIRVIEYFEVQPQTNEAAIWIYKRRRDGTYIVNHKI